MPKKKMVTVTKHGVAQTRWAEGREGGEYTESAEKGAAAGSIDLGFDDRAGGPPARRASSPEEIASAVLGAFAHRRGFGGMAVPIRDEGGHLVPVPGSEHEEAAAGILAIAERSTGGIDALERMRALGPGLDGEPALHGRFHREGDWLFINDRPFAHVSDVAPAAEAIGAPATEPEREPRTDMEFFDAADRLRRAPEALAVTFLDSLPGPGTTRITSVPVRLTGTARIDEEGAPQFDIDSIEAPEQHSHVDANLALAMLKIDEGRGVLTGRYAIRVDERTIRDGRAHAQAGFRIERDGDRIIVNGRPYATVQEALAALGAPADEREAREAGRATLDRAAAYERRGIELENMGMYAAEAAMNRD